MKTKLMLISIVIGSLIGLADNLDEFAIKSEIMKSRETFMSAMKPTLHVAEDQRIAFAKDYTKTVEKWSNHFITNWEGNNDMLKFMADEHESYVFKLASFIILNKGMEERLKAENNDAAKYLNDKMNDLQKLTIKNDELRDKVSIAAVQAEFIKELIKEKEDYLKTLQAKEDYLNKIENELKERHAAIKRHIEQVNRQAEKVNRLARKVGLK